MAQDGKDLDVFKRPPDVNKLGVFKKKRKVKVLDEDEYVEKLEKIIERDFFPEIDKLKARSDYIDAADRNDTNEMRRLRERFSTGRMPTDSMSRLSTPATFDTPQTSKDKSDEKEPSKAQASINHPAENTLAKDDNGEDDELKDVTLDTFLSKHTSEDNEAFNDIVEEQREIFVKNHEWMFKNDEQLSLEHKATSLVLPSIENQCSTISTESKPLDGWTYKNVNPVFYNPDDIEILRYIECYGNSPKVFHALALELQRDHWTCVRTRYYRIKETPGNEIKDRAAYSEEEDKLILEYIEKYGNCKDAYDRLCQELQRNINSVRARRNLLTKRYLDRKTEWKIEEDEALMKSILQVRNSTLLQDVYIYLKNVPNK